MKSLRLILFVLLACVAATHARPVSAQPHEEIKVTGEAFVAVTDPAAMAEWLRRLVGRFKFDGAIQLGAQPTCPPQCEPIKGLGDCVAVGTGPGVQCIFNITWQDMFQTNFDQGTVDAPPGAVAYLDPAMALFGLDPGAAAVNNLLVNDKGLPEGSRGGITNITAKFSTQCVNEVSTCRRVMRIEAKPDSNLIYMWIDAVDSISRDPISSIVMTLRRVPQTTEEEAPTLKRPERAGPTRLSPTGGQSRKR